MKLIFHIFASLAEFERDLIRERTNAGLKAARDMVRIRVRPKAMDNKKISMAKSLVNDSDVSIKNICETLNVSRATLYRYLKESNSMLIILLE